MYPVPGGDLVIITTMDEQQRADWEQQRADIELKLMQAQLATAEALLAIKKVRWYEVVLFGGAGITIGLALAKLFTS